MIAKTITVCLLCLLFLFSPGLADAGSTLPEWKVSSSAIFSQGDQNPFWLFSNREGKFAPEGHQASVSFGLFADSDTGRAIDYEYGLELYGRTGQSDDLWIHQGYAGLKIYELVQLKAGWWTDVIKSPEPDLSSGSMIWSGNARPMPRIQAGTPGYIDVPFTKGRVEIKGLISHGWFEDGRFVDDAWMHHKNAFVRLGGDFPVNFYYGLNHFAQWGGSSSLHEEPYPTDFDAFYRIFFINSGNPDHPGTLPTWVNHKLGNHLGSRSHGLDFALESIEAGVFLQDVMDDLSGWRRQNFPDGLWSLWLRFREENKAVQAFTYEYLQTTDQSGRYHDLDGEILGGNDNYFNHAIYQSGWSYHGFTLGTPFITSPILNDPAWHRFENTRVRVHHLGIKGHLSETLSYHTLFSYSRNYGTYGRYSDPYDPRRDQYSWMLELSGPVNFFDLEASVAIAIDSGEMYGNNIGLMLQLVRKGNFGQ